MTNKMRPILIWHTLADFPSWTRYVKQHILDGNRIVDIFKTGSCPVRLIAVLSKHHPSRGYEVVEAKCKSEDLQDLLMDTDLGLVAIRFLGALYGSELHKYPKPLNGVYRNIQVHVSGQAISKFPVGPARDGVSESIKFSIYTGGEDVIALVPEFGYKSRHITTIALNRDVDYVVNLAERICGTSVVAQTLAFVRAVEMALDIGVDNAEHHFRALLLEFERLHSHVAAIAKICEACGLLVPVTQLLSLKNQLLEAYNGVFGHRYMRGVIRIGQSQSIDKHSLYDLGKFITRVWYPRFTQLIYYLRETTTLHDRLHQAGTVPEYAAKDLMLVGPVARASGLQHDSRLSDLWVEYIERGFELVTKQGGDALARTEVLIDEVSASINLIENLHGVLTVSQVGKTSVSVEGSWCQGMGLGITESPNGETVHYVKVNENNSLDMWHVRTASWKNWAGFVVACQGKNNITDIPVIDASFSLPVSEVDL